VNILEDIVHLDCPLFARIVFANERCRFREMQTLCKTT